MTKQLIVLALAAAFGVAHAADAKPSAEMKPAATPTAAVVKAEAKAPEVKPAATAPEAKSATVTKPVQPKAPDAHSADAAKAASAKAAEPVKK